VANTKVFGSILQICVGGCLAYYFTCLYADTTGKSISSNASRAAPTSLLPSLANANLRRSFSIKQHHSEASECFSREGLTTVEVRSMFWQTTRLLAVIIIRGNFTTRRDFSWTAHCSCQLNRRACPRNGIQPTGITGIVLSHCFRCRN